MNIKSAAEVLGELIGSKKNLKIKLLGDSITHGVGGEGWEQNGEVIVDDFAQSPDSYCWANLFRDYMKEKYGATVVNKGCTGTTVEFIIHYFNTLVDPDDDLVVCTIGTNNRHLYMAGREKKSHESMLSEFYENIKRLYGMFCDKKIPVIFMANIPASAENEQDGPNYWRILHMWDINDAYKKLAAEQGATVVSLYDLFSAYCEDNEVALDSLLCDGLHPNNEGYKVMFDLIINEFGA